MSDNRKNWLDISKGLGIIVIVLGHSGFPHSKYLFWFHIPLFFFISGYLFNHKSEISQSRFIGNKLKRLILPYFTYAFFIFILHISGKLLLHGNVGRDSLKLLFKIFYGGKTLTEAFGVFWFITSLFLTNISFNWLSKRFSHKKLITPVIMLFLYSMAMIYSFTFRKIALPWSLETILMAIPIFYLGHISQNVKFKSNTLALISTLIIATAIIIDRFALLSINFDMKQSIYGVPFLNLILALAFIYPTNYLARLGEKIKLITITLGFIGKISLVIMFLHLPVKQLLYFHLGIKNYLIITACSVFVSIIFYMIVKKHHLTKKLFLGEK